MTLGKKIYELRIEKGYSQEEFASQLNVSRQAVSKWERDETLPDLYNLKNIAKIFNISMDELLDQNNEQVNHTEKEDIKTESNLIKYGIYGLIIGAIIHFVSSFSGAVDSILYLGYLNTGDLEMSSFLYGFIRFSYDVSFFGYPFYYLWYLMLLIVLDGKLKANITVILGVNFFLIVFMQITQLAGINLSIIDFLIILNYVTTVIINLFFLKIIKPYNANSELRKLSTLIFYAFIMEIALTVISIFVRFFIFDEINRTVFTILITLGYAIANLFFLVFSYWLLQDRKKLLTNNLRKNEPILRKVRRMGLILIATVFTPLLIISFYSSVSDPLEIFGMLLFGFVVFIIFGIIMIILEKITS